MQRPAQIQLVGILPPGTDTILSRGAGQTRLEYQHGYYSIIARYHELNSYLFSEIAYGSEVKVKSDSGFKSSLLADANGQWCFSQEEKRWLAAFEYGENKGMVLFDGDVKKEYANIVYGQFSGRFYGDGLLAVVFGTIEAGVNTLWCEIWKNGGIVQSAFQIGNSYSVSVYDDVLAVKISSSDQAVIVKIFRNENLKYDGAGTFRQMVGSQAVVGLSVIGFSGVLGKAVLVGRSGQSTVEHGGPIYIEGQYVFALGALSSVFFIYYDGLKIAERTKIYDGEPDSDGYIEYCSQSFAFGEQYAGILERFTTKRTYETSVGSFPFMATITTTEVKKYREKYTIFCDGKIIDSDEKEESYSPVISEVKDMFFTVNARGSGIIVGKYSTQPNELTSVTIFANGYKIEKATSVPVMVISAGKFYGCAKIAFPNAAFNTSLFFEGEEFASSCLRGYLVGGFGGSFVDLEAYVAGDFLAVKRCKAEAFAPIESIDIYWKKNLVTRIFDVNDLDVFECALGGSYCIVGYANKRMLIYESTVVDDNGVQVLCRGNSAVFLTSETAKLYFKTTLAFETDTVTNISYECNGDFAFIRFPSDDKYEQRIYWKGESAHSETDDAEWSGGAYRPIDVVTNKLLPRQGVELWDGGLLVPTAFVDKIGYTGAIVCDETLGLMCFDSQLQRVDT